MLPSQQRRWRQSLDSMESLFDLVTSLRLAWATSIIIIVLLASFQLLAPFSGRGKTLSSSKFTVPQRYFLHFYVVGVAWTTCLLTSTWLYAREITGVSGLNFSIVAEHLMGSARVEHLSSQYRTRVWVSVFLLLLMEVQVLRRLYETVYVFDYASSARMHVVAYFTGLCFYVAAPLSFCSSFAPEILSHVTSQVAEFIIKGEAGIPITKVYWWPFVKPLAQLGWRQWIGASIFIWGWIHQLRCHSILGSLRQQPGTSTYVIPHGDWFDVVSCPHYLAEIVIYAGILLGSDGSDVTVWLAFVFVASNLIFAAAQTHRWYQEKFENYPRSRHAILPMIY